jgi:hypothetical protein
VALMPELGYQPVNRYLPPRVRRDGTADVVVEAPTAAAPSWLTRILRR